MNAITIMLNFAHECFVLGGLTFSILVLLGAIGLWPVLTFFPRGDALRWPLFAPVTGLALLTVLGLPLSLAGMPVNRWAPVVAVFGMLSGTAAVLQIIRTAQGRRLIVSFFRIRYVYITIIFLVPVLLSTYLIAGHHGGHVRDIWGSGDFGAYWILADFLQDNGATVQSYTNQNIYYSSDIQDHLSKHARLGCMVSVSYFGSLISSEHINHVIIPFIVAAIVLMLGLAQQWLEYERMGNRWLIVPLLSYPFLYFLLYFTYVSQTTGVLLFSAGLLLIGRVQVDAPGRTNTSRILWSGILVGASILHYPSLLLASVICMIFLIINGLKSSAFRTPFLWTAAVILMCSYYLPQIIHELSRVNSGSILPGWDWQSMLGALEFIGFRTVLGYDLPLSRSMGIKLLEIVAGFGLCVLLLYGVWVSRLRVVSLTVVTTTGLLSVAAYVKFFQQIPHSSHAVVKSVSLFALFLLLVMMFPLGRLLSQNREFHKVLLMSLTGILIVGQLVSLDYGTRQRCWYTDDLVNLSRRQLEKGYNLRFAPDIHWQMRAPIIRDTRRAIQEDAGINIPLLTVIRTDRLPNYAMSRIVDKEGDYVAVYCEPLR